MSPLVWLAMAGAGGVGAASRLMVDGLIRNRIRIGYPLGTTVINVSGSFLLGVITGLTLSLVLSSDWKTVLGTGLMGGYTTFSTASFETIRLFQERRWGAALTNGVGMLVVSIALAYLGVWIGELI
jgi:CrcB protein